MSLDNLPVEWLLTELNQVLTVRNGYAFKSKDYISEKISDDLVSVIRISDIQDNSVSTLKSIFVEKEKASQNFKIDKGDLLIAMSGATTGKTGIFREETQAFLNQRVGNLKVHSAEYFLPKFRNFLIQNLSNQILENAYGGAQPNISSKDIESLVFGLPPLAEQQEIVRQLDVMLAQVEQIKARLDAIPAILKKFRQSVLAEAVSGKLTEADVSNWTEVTVNDLVNIVNGKPFPSSDYSAQGIKLLRPGNLHMSGKVKWSDKNTIYLPKDWKEKRPELLLKEGSLLMNLTAQSLADEFLGRVCILETADEDILLNQRISSFESKLNYDVKPYLFYLFKSPQFRTYVDTLDTGTLIKHLNIKDIKTYKLRLPPEIEQMEIVTLLNSFMRSASRTEELVFLAKKRVNLLTQSILAKAFSGELTAEWRTQHQELITGVNSAESLLAKIQVEREASKPVKKVKKAKVV